MLRPSAGIDCTPCQWQYAFGTQAGATLTFANIGAQAATGASVNSQNLNMFFRDGSNVEQHISVAATPGGLAISTTGVATSAGLAVPAGAVIGIGDGGGLDINSHVVLAGSGATLGIGSDAGWTQVGLGNATSGTIIVGSTINFNGPVTSSSTITLSSNPVYAVSGATTNGHCVEFGTGNILTDTGAPCSSGGGGGSVTSVGLTVPGSSILGASGSPITTAGTIGLTTTGTSGGIPYFSSTSQLTSSALLTNNAILTGGGAGASPKSVAITGLVLGNGASAPSAYGGASACSSGNFVTALSAAGATTCANTGLGTMAAQNANAVTITGGTFTSGATNYIAPAGPYDPNPSLAAASIALVMGSAGSPDTSINSALIVQRIGSNSSSALNNASILGILEDRGNTTPTHHGTAIEGVTNTAVAYSAGSPVYSFFEGIRGQCNANTGSTNVQCEAIAGEVNYAANGYFYIGIEGADNNNTGGAVSTLGFNFRDLHDFAFAASCGDHAGTPLGYTCGGAYWINNLGDAPFLCGVCIVGSGAISSTGSNIYFANTGAKYGLDMRFAGFANAAIVLPNEVNGGYIEAENAAGSNILQIVGINGSNQAVFGTDPAVSAAVIGNTGVGTFVLGALTVSGGVTLTAAAPTVAAAQIGYGSTTAAAANCNVAVPTPTGCVVINVAGTTRYIPYY